MNQRHHPGTARRRAAHMVCAARWLGVLALLAVALVLPCAPLSAQPGDTFKVLEDALAAQRSGLDSIKKKLAEGALNDEELDKAEDALRKIRTGLLDIARQMKGPWEANRKALKDLGPPPKAGEKPEPEEVAGQRAELARQQKRLDNLVRGSDVFAGQAARLVDTIRSLRRERFFERAFSRQRPPISAFLWKQAGNSLQQAGARISAEIARLQTDARSTGAMRRLVLVFAVVLVLTGAGYLFARRWLMSRLDRSFAARKGRTSGRVGEAGLYFLARIIPLALAGTILLATLRLEGLLAATPYWFGWAVLGALLIVPVALALRRTIVQHRINLPGLPDAGTLARPSSGVAVLVIGLVLTIDSLLRAGGSILGTSLYFAFAQSFVFAILMSLMILVLAWRSGERKPARKAVRSRLWRWPNVRIVFLAAAIVTILAELFGYLALGRYLIRTVFFVAVIAALYSLLRASARELALRAEQGFFGSTRNGDQVTDRPHLMFAFWAGLLVDVLLLLAGLISLLLIFRFRWIEIRDWLSQAFQGVKIGSVNISLIDAAAAIVVFLAFVALTRFVQRFFARELFPRTRLDTGVRDSLVRFTGYAGLLVAALTGIATLGVDLSSLAIIAGALSLGVGFGLQSIVNNFVSGLILLFERPIKVGDWIVTDSGEGHVRRIGVRSTIIDTFDRTALIIPNSELVVSTVKNWTLKDPIGRADIRVGVSYDANPRQVEEILYACAADHSGVLSKPPPVVLFNDFGESSLDFELRVFLPNIRNILDVTTALRFEIFERFAAAGIEIPFPQRDVHVREAARGTSMPETRAAGARKKPRRRR